MPYTLTFTTPVAGPPNITCATALPIACGQTLLGNTTNAPLSSLTTAGVGCNYSSNRILYYQLVGTGDVMEVLTCHPTTNFPVVVSVMSGTCGALTCLGSGDYDSGCSYGVSNGKYRFASVAGTTYYIAVTGYNSGFSGSGNFGLTVTCVAPACVAPAGVVTASLITNTTASISFTAPTGPAPAGYRVTAIPYGGGAAITATGTASPIVLTGLTPGTEYNATVQTQCGTGFSLPSVQQAYLQTTGTMPCPAAFAIATNPITTTSTAVTLVINNAALPTGTIFQITYTAAGGQPQTATSNTAGFQLTGLIPGTVYTLSVVTNCGGGGVSAAATTTFTTAGPLATRNGLLAASVGLFPNPAHHAATLAVPATLLRQPVQVVLLNSMGQVVRRLTVPAAATDAQVSLDLATLPAGLYLVQAATGQGTLVKRLLVE